MVNKSSAPVEHVRFGVFEFDCRSGELYRDGISLKLQPQPAKVLGILVGRRGEIISPSGDTASAAITTI